MKSRTRIARVHVDFDEVVNKMWAENRGRISKVAITQDIAKMIRKQRQPRYVIDYWPLSRKKVKVY